MGRRNDESSDKGREERRKERVTSPDGENETCNKCEKEVKGGQRGLECGLCLAWYHAGCEKVSKDEYTGLKMSGDAGEWFCRQCKGQFASLKRANAMLREENKVLKEENESLKSRLDIVEKKLANIDINVEDIKDKVIESIREENERKEKKKNIVVFNLPETEGETEERKKDQELATCSDIIYNEIGVQQAEIVQVTRMGRPREGNS